MITKPLAYEDKRQDLIINRVFIVTPERLFQAWSDPKQLIQWWGPKTYTTPVVKIDFRVGGQLLFCLRSADGQDTWGKEIYKEIVSPSRIVATDSFADPQGNIVPASYYDIQEEMPLELLLTFTFEEQPGGTKFTLIHSGLPAGEISELTRAGWNEMFDKLNELLLMD
jgi:uncharacterized protein YndB with AHSA1/START domain